MTLVVPVALALPWILGPIVIVLRARRSRSLDEYQADVHAGAPLLTVVIPARNEARNIERCVRSVLASTYPRLEVIAVDDHSTDATASILHALASEDARLRVVVPAPLPEGWFGKQWACSTGAAASGGDIIAFFDADTWQTPDLLPRCVNAMQDRAAELLTVGGMQVMGSFWERMLQPQVFAVLVAQFGGTEVVNESSHATQKIANGQCIIARRKSYDALGGHGAVRHKVAEDIAIAQLYFRTGHRTILIAGLEQLFTRMYTSLRELVDGYGKNVYAGGRDVMPFGTVGKVIYPFAIMMPALCGLLPPVVLALALAGVLGSAALLWAAIATSANLLWWLSVYLWLGLSPIYAVLHPLGSAAFLYIVVRSIARGKRVQWKGRDYRA